MGRVYSRIETRGVTCQNCGAKARGPVPKGKLTWYLAYKHGGELIRRVSGARTKTEALEELRDLETDERRGLLRYPAKIRFLDFVPEYLAIKEGAVKTGSLEPSSLERIRLSVDWLDAFFGERFLHSITPTDVERYRQDRLGGKIRLPRKPGKAPRHDRKSITPRTVNRELAQLKNFFTVAEKQGKFTGQNPVRRIEFAPEPRRVPPPLGVYQFQRIIQVAQPRLRQLIVVGAYTLKRKMEILTLEWDHVNWEENRIYIPKTKSGEDNWVAMNKELRDTLLEILEQTPKTEDGKPRSRWVFWSPIRQGEHLRGYQEWMADLKSKLREVSNPEDYQRYYERLWFHNLRHFAASLLEKKGVDIMTLSKMLGHKSRRTTEIYLHGVEEDQHQAAALLGKLLRESTNHAQISDKRQ